MTNVVQALFRRQARHYPETVVASSFGLNNTTLGPGFDALGLINSERVRDLQYREAFYTCKVHDWKMFDFNGRVITPSRASGVQPLISTAAPSFYVPLDQRRPATPYRLSRKIVNSFTAMLFGHGRWPQIRSEDRETQDFAEALISAAKIGAKMIRARTIGGRCGTVGLSWCFYEGKPRVKVHHGSHCHVLEWDDEDERIPAHVVEIYQAPEDYFQDGKRKRKMFWKRRDWTKTADVVFKPIEVGKKNPDRWEIDEEASFEHGDGFTHFVWIENLPDEINKSDGMPDYAEAYEPLNSLDILNSVNVRGATLNLDPTLKFRMDREDLKGSTISKGSEHAIVTGKDGDVGYLELSGSSIAAGSTLIENLRAQILETVECVVLDPDKATAAGSSSVALRIVYAPMLAKTDILREQYGDAIVRLLDQMITSARLRMPTEIEVEEDEAPIEVETEGVEVEEGVEVVADGEPIEVEEEEPIEYFVDLPPRVEQQTDEETGTVIEVTHERTPGNGRIWLEWGPYFKPTTSDYQQAAGALSSATAGKSVMSQQTAVELNANVWDRDGSEEWARVVEEQRAAYARQTEGMFPGIGGAVEDGDELPEDQTLPPDETPAEGDVGAVEEIPEQTPEQTQKPMALGQTAALLPSAPEIELAPTDIGKIVTVNESRLGLGLGPLTRPGTTIPDPDGYLTIAEFTAKRKARTEAATELEVEAGKAEIKKAAEPPEPPPTPPTPQAPPVPTEPGGGMMP